MAANRKEKHIRPGRGESRKMHAARDLSVPDKRKYIAKRLYEEHCFKVALAKEEILEYKDRIDKLTENFNNIISTLDSSEADIDADVLENVENIALKAIMLSRKIKTSTAGLDKLEKEYHETLRVTKFDADKKAKESYVHRYKSEEPRSAALALAGALSTASFFTFNNLLGPAAVTAALGPVGIAGIAVAASILIGFVAYNVFRRAYRNYKSEYWIPRKKRIQHQRKIEEAQKIEELWNKRLELEKKSNNNKELGLGHIVEKIKTGELQTGESRDSEKFKELLKKVKGANINGEIILQYRSEASRSSSVRNSQIIRGEGSIRRARNNRPRRPDSHRRQGGGGRHR